MMKTDIQIAQEAELMHIKDVAASIGISEEELEFYGKYKADPGMRRKDHDHSRSG